ncbi:type IV secretory system conjugative DNA transfer family protein [Nocardioides sp.]|uniref:type IV secretory system conjugative DNA transfer family protein n=1 Tax=Nocardioides sp. TaxID=35761 RepID=UPI003D0BE669
MTTEAQPAAGAGLWRRYPALPASVAVFVVLQLWLPLVPVWATAALSLAAGVTATRYARRLGAWGLVLGGGIVAAHLVWPVPLLLIDGCLAALVSGALVWRELPSGRLRRRLGAGGWLGWRELWSEAGRWAVRRQGRSVRPGLVGRHVPRAYGAPLGRLLSGPVSVLFRRVYSVWSRGILILGPQGSGKTQLLVNLILDAPGAAYVSSTKTELHALTAQLREAAGPVAVFNPTGLGGVESTFRWDLVADCADPAIADARARALVRGGGGVGDGVKDADFWADRAAEIIRCFLLAAALQRKGMDAVMGWALDLADSTPLDVLGQHPELVPAGWLGTLQRHLGAAHTTLSGYLAAVTPAVAWMDDPRVAAACSSWPGPKFDIAGFVRSRGTLYVIAGDGDQRIAPLITALTEAVFATAKRAAAAEPAGRLDPPLSMCLDEIAQTTPVPLDRWAADSRGWGVTVCAVAQDLAQLETRWGSSRARTIFANLPTKLVLRGVSGHRDLESLAYLTGRRTVQRESSRRTEGDDGRTGRTTSTSAAEEQVLGGHAIYGLPMWHALVLGLGPRPAVVRYTPGWVRCRRERHRRAVAGWFAALRRRPGILVTTSPAAAPVALPVPPGAMAMEDKESA